MRNDSNRTRQRVTRRFPLSLSHRGQRCAIVCDNAISQDRGSLSQRTSEFRRREPQVRLSRQVVVAIPSSTQLLEFARFDRMRKFRGVNSDPNLIAPDTEHKDEQCYDGEPADLLGRSSRKFRRGAFVFRWSKFNALIGGPNFL